MDFSSAPVLSTHSFNVITIRRHWVQIPILLKFLCEAQLLLKLVLERERDLHSEFASSQWQLNW